MGPPPVRAKIRAKYFNEPTMTSTAALTMVGHNKGMVIRQKDCKEVAPSILAASYNSSGILVIPAMKIIIYKGIYCQQVATTTE